MRLRSLVVALATALSLRPRDILAQQLPAGYDQGIFEVRLARLASMTGTAIVSPSGGVLLPVDRVLALTGLPVDRSADGLRRIPAIGGGQTTLDLARRRIVRQGSELPLAADELVVYSGEHYLLADRLADLLQGTVVVDFATLSATLTRTPPFPAERQREAQGRRATLGARPEARSSSIERSIPYPARSGGVVLDWAVSAAGQDLRRGTSVDLRSGIALLGGDLTTGVVLTDGRLAEPSGNGSWSFRRGFPTSSWLRQVQVGDALTGASLARSVRGVTFTNARVVREQYFTDIPIAPDVPRGWQYEVYQSGQLLGYSDGVGGVPVVVPLRYGTTPLQVRMISPAGEEIVSNVSVLVPSTQLQPGRVEYVAGGGRCSYRDCEHLAFATVSWGARSWLTLTSGAEYLRDSVRATTSPQGTVSLATMTGWFAQGQVAANAFSRLAAGFAGDGHLTGQVVGSIDRPSAAQPSYLPLASSRWSTQSHLQFRPSLDGSTRVGALRLETRGEGDAQGGPGHWTSEASVDLRRTSLGATYEYDVRLGVPLYGVRTLTVLPAALPRPLANAAVDGAIAAGGGGLVQGTASSSLVLGRARVGVSARWPVGQRPSFSVGLTSILPFARASSHVIQGLTGTTSASSAAGSIVADRHHGVSFFEQDALGSAGVSGSVFYDNDGDGKLGVGDSVAAGVNIVTGPGRAITDGGGSFRSWYVAPYDVAEVSIDTLRGIDPSWIPLRTRTYVRATPDMFNRVDFPLVRTRELAGTVVADSGVATSGGLTLVITDSATGTARREFTYSDGQYYVSRMRPGAYDLEVPANVLELLHATATPARIHFTVSPLGADPVVTLPTIQLRPIALDPQVVVFAPAPRCPNPPAGVPLDSIGCPILFKEKRTLTLRGVSFSVDRAELTPASIEVLSPIADALAADTSLRIEVAGHTDASGGHAHNVRLSQARAESVRRFFIEHGVDSTRMAARGYGPDQPMGSNRTAAGRALNRRTELRRLDHPPPPEEFTVQVGSFADSSGALRVVRRLTAQGFQPRIVDQKGPYAVRVGRFATRAQATAQLRRLRARRVAGTVTLAEPH